VSGPAHSDSHLRDAATAAIAFLNREHDLKEATAVRARNPLSLLGAVALWCGLTDDVAALHRETVVIKPNVAYVGDIQAA
jgi:hypothetical protein